MCSDDCMQLYVNSYMHYGVQTYTSAEQTLKLTLTVWSTDPVAITLIRLCSSLPPFSSPPPIDALPQARQVTKWPCASSVFTHRPVVKSHTRNVLSSDAESKYFPLGWKTSARTQLSWPFCCQSCPYTHPPRPADIVQTLHPRS